ncbi:MAG: 4-(cytidine 5'-diphospho)-2-C-methyl-D-erythritol kinase, partial [Thermodesulfobacteriota bacterium]
MSSITLLSPAKINLTLEVLGARTDGYHEIRSIVQPIDLFDEVSIDVEEGEGIEIESSGVSIPTGKDNLAWPAKRVSDPDGQLDRIEKAARINEVHRVPEHI